MQHPIPVTLSEIDRASLQTFIHAGKASARIFARAYALLKAADGWSDEHICEAFDISRNTSIKMRRTYLEEGLDAVLHDKKQRRYRQALTGEQVAHLIAIACTPAPTGHDHWTVRLLAGKAVELGFVSSISPETIRQQLKKISSNPGNTSAGASQR
jgi:transposase